MVEGASAICRQPMSRSALQLWWTLCLLTFLALPLTIWEFQKQQYDVHYQGALARASCAGHLLGRWLCGCPYTGLGALVLLQPCGMAQGCGKGGRPVSNLGPALGYSSAPGQLARFPQPTNSLTPPTFLSPLPRTQRGSSEGYS